jgi:hypothetical protein
MAGWAGRRSRSGLPSRATSLPSACAATMARMELSDSLVAQIKGGGEPPDLQLGSADERCGLCMHWDAPTSTCQIYGVQTREVEVCGDFAPAGEAPDADGMV